MKKMYDELKTQGLEVVSVTQYYGYYGTERGITPDQEFAKLADHVKEFNITWPLVVGPKTNSENYGVGGIPHYVVIGRDGKVASVTIGYSPDLFKTLRASVEKCLNAKTASR